MKRQLIWNNEYHDMQLTFDKLYAEAKQGKKFTNLIDIIGNENNIILAYRNIKKNKGSETPGIDKVTIEYFDKMETRKFISKIQEV